MTLKKSLKRFVSEIVHMLLLKSNVEALLYALYIPAGLSAIPIPSSLLILLP